MTTETIWMEFSDRLRGFIRARINDRDTAEDILQDVFIRIHEKSKQIKDDTKVVSWVYQITRNAIIDFYRKKKLVSPDASVPDFIEEDEEELLINSQFTKCMTPFLENLSPKYQDALNNTLFGSKSQKEYAAELNISYTAMKSRVQRAKKELKENFVQCCSIKTDAYGNVISSKLDDCDC